MLKEHVFFFTALAFLWLSGCATYRPIPEDHSGPTTTVNDSGAVEDGSKAQLYVLAAMKEHLERSECDDPE